VTSVKQQLQLRTYRVRRTVLERLIGIERAFETKISDGHRDVYGRGSTPESSQALAEKKWSAIYGAAPGAQDALGE
jgi:hypothetical protein